MINPVQKLSLVLFLYILVCFDHCFASSSISKNDDVTTLNIAISAQQPSTAVYVHHFGTTNPAVLEILPYYNSKFREYNRERGNGDVREQINLFTFCFD